MIRFYTFFDETYLAQARAMIDSLRQHASEPIRVCVTWLGDFWKCPDLGCGVDVVSMRSLMGRDKRLAVARENRTYREFAWTLEPFIVHSALCDREDGELIVYVDADSWFLADPIPGILSAMEGKSIGLTPHHFPPEQKNRERTCGKFNFGFGVFRNSALTRGIVADWLDKTLARCSETDCGDQKYLDEWPALLGNQLAELPKVMNVGPWRLADISGMPPLLNGERLVSFHAHEFRRSATGHNPVELNGERWNMTFYPIKDSTRKAVYEPYCAEVSKWLSNGV